MGKIITSFINDTVRFFRIQFSKIIQNEFKT